MRTSILAIGAACSIMFAKAEGAGSGAAAPNKGEPAPPKPEAGAVTGQLDNAKAVAVTDMSKPTVTVNGKAFKVKQVTRNVFPQRDGQTLLVQITGKVYQGKALENGKSEMAPAELAEVVNLETGVLGLIIVNKVLHGQLDELYPEAGYVGKSFAITMSPVEGKRYKAFTLYELEAADAE